MNRFTDEHLLAFLEGTLDEEQRAGLLEAVEGDPRLASQLRSAAMGLAAVETLAESGRPDTGKVIRSGRPISPWWAAAIAAATLVVAIPTTLWVSSLRPPDPVSTPVAAQPESGFVLVLHGRWPDAATLEDGEARRRAGEYWAWASSLADDSLLMAAGDLRWEPGSRLGPNGVAMTVSDAVVESADFVVGMFALRVGSYQQAIAIARQCPHLRYGGSISVRQVGTGFLSTGTSGG